MERLNLDEESPYSPSELAIHSVRYLPVKDLVKGKVVLDAACGEGLGSYLMHTWGAKQVVGIDISAEAIRKARRRFGREGISFYEADISEFLRRKAKYDLITCIETIEHLPNPPHTLRRFAQACKANSLIFISCPNDNWYYGRGVSLNDFHLKVYTFEAFKEITESILGPAAGWYLGTVANGFVTAPYGAAGAETYDDAVQTLVDSRLAGLLAPGTGAPESLTPERSLYFAGLWVRGRASIKTPTPAVTVWPTAADYRQGPISHLPPSAYRTRPGNILFIADNNDRDARHAALALRAAWRLRLPAKFLWLNPRNRERVLQAAMLRSRASHVHLFGAALATLVLADPALLRRALGASKLSVDDFVRRWSSPSLSFWSPAATVGRALHVRAPLFDSFALTDEFPAISRRQVLIPTVAQGEEQTREWLKQWLELLRRADIAAAGGTREARAAVWRMQLQAVEKARA